MNLKTMKKTTKSNLITYAMVIVIFAVVQILVATGSMSSLMQGLLV
ncbi:MAG TPA: amino acid ABC transporter permease, partial [Roseburia sp.]|nr:amino acid ABC transporter permease [Roseburia sp.]